MPMENIIQTQPFLQPNTSGFLLSSNLRKDNTKIILDCNNTSTDYSPI